MTEKSKSFDEYYKQLNTAQKEAVDAVEGPVMVVAGPGTGKTQILTLRIANILRTTDTEPENILALTFTESGVASMRRRLVEIIGSPAYAVAINTFHGFCNEVIKGYPEEFPHIVSAEHITEVDQIKLLEEIIEKLPLKELKPFGDTFYYLRAILRNVNDLKREGVGPDRFAKLVTEEEKAFEKVPDLYHEKGPHAGKMKGEYQKRARRIAKNKELVAVYEAYQAELARAKRYDWSDMIMEVLRALERNENLLLILQEQYQYILVDEHQDTNNAQNKILELLANFHEDPNIFVVGDEKQAIFRFQGASLENFLYFKTLYPKARLITLEENYRSTQVILDSAHSLIAGERALRANARHSEAKIERYAFSRPEIETYFIARSIRKRIEEGTAPNEIAVLYRDNRDAFPIARALERAGVPFVIESDQDILDDPDIRKLLLLLRTVEQYGRDDLAAEAMHVDFLHLEPLDVYKIVAHAGEHRIRVLDVMRAEEVLQGIGVENIPAVLGFANQLSRWKTQSKNRDVLSFFELVVRESGFLSSVLGMPDSVEKIDKLNALFDELKSLVEAHRTATLADLFVYLDTLNEHDLLIKKNLARHVVREVRLMTAHRSKGQEFGHVHIVNAYDGHWGNKRRANVLPLPLKAYSLMEREIEWDEEDDERRLFYVALTRAKRGVTISYAKTSTVGREQLPSQFLEELRADRVEEKDPEEWEAAYTEDAGEAFAPEQAVYVDVRNKDFVRELFLKYGFSVTGLNNYLECPWKYFYTNLLRIPQAKTKHQMYGTAVHAALHDLFEAAPQREPDKEFLLARFEFHLRREAFREHDLLEALEKGRRALGGYFDHYAGTWNLNTQTEFGVKGVMLSPDIRLTGKIDKMEMGDGGAVNVVDYKTGRPKSRGEIEGSTKTSNGNIKRQLIFYKLLLDLFHDGKYAMRSGEIDFVEPNERGVYKKERFTIEEAEVEELRALTERTAEEILSLSFWDRTCGEEKCEYCGLRAMMGANESSLREERS